MRKNTFLIFTLFFFYLVSFSFPANAHTFTGMVGFYDGLFHPVLGIDHFLAMVSVGIVSSQIGGRVIWTVPATFVGVMIVGGIIGIAAEINKGFDDQVISLSEAGSLNYFADYIYTIIEFGIVLSVILLGLAIAIEKKLSVGITMIFVSFFGLCHGAAHGLEMPWAANPVLFFRCLQPHLRGRLVPDAHGHLRHHALCHEHGPQCLHGRPGPWQFHLRALDRPY